MNDHKKVTLRLPASLLQRLRVNAAERGESMTSLMSQAIQKMIAEDQQNAKGKRRFLERIHNAPDRGTHGVIRWTREELHQR